MTSSTTAMAATEVTDCSVNTQNYPHNLSWTHQGKTHSDLLGSTRQNGCRSKTWGCQSYVCSSPRPPFNVAANGHDYLEVGRYDESAQMDCDYSKNGTCMPPLNMVPYAENSVEIRSSNALEEKVVEENAQNSSGLVLRKEKKSWTVKLKTHTSSASSEENLTSGLKPGLKPNSIGASTKSHISNVDNNNGGFNQESPCKCCSASKNNKALHSFVPRKPSCTTDKSKTENGKLCKIRIKDVNGNGPLVRVLPQKTKYGTKVKKKKKKEKKKKSAVSPANEPKKSTQLNGRHQNGQRDLLLEGREGEEAAYRALASTNGLPKGSKSVKKAEKEIARALEIIQLQLKVLQTHKKQKSTTKSGKVTKKGKGGKLNSKKKRHSWEPSYTIKFADFFPLPPSLTVRGGDLFPACSMRADPFCAPGPNHPIWRWRLGKKPLPRPPSRRLSVENASEGTSR